jgi:hypothetical protein
VQAARESAGSQVPARYCDQPRSGMLKQWSSRASMYPPESAKYRHPTEHLVSKICLDRTQFLRRMQKPPSQVIFSCSVLTRGASALQKAPTLSKVVTSKAKAVQWKTGCILRDSCAFAIYKLSAVE